MRWATVLFSSANQPAGSGAASSCVAAGHSPYSGGGSCAVSRAPTTPVNRSVNAGSCTGMGVVVSIDAGRSAPNIVTVAASVGRCGGAATAG